LTAYGPGAVPALLEGLSTSDPLVRREIVEALGAIGHASAIPAIERAARDPDGVVRKRAERALLGLRCAAK
jgi:HEAT repeat protein